MFENVSLVWNTTHETKRAPAGALFFTGPIHLNVASGVAATV